VPTPTPPPTEITNTVTPIPAGNRTWSIGQNSPSARLELGAAALHGKIYAVGGADSNFRALTDVFVYDPLTDTWSQTAPLPGPRESRH
jgi:hypothetical protein